MFGRPVPGVAQIAPSGEKLCPAVSTAVPAPETEAMAEAWISDRFSAPCPAPAPEARPAGPDVFNSIALPVKATALDSRWAHAKIAPDDIADGQWAAISSRAATQSPHERLQMVNNWVNRHIVYSEDGPNDRRNDHRNDRPNDHWANLTETIARGRGDCEDFAIAKMQLLERAGVRADALYLVIVADTVRNVDHAVLAVREDGAFLVLDNRTDRIMRSGEITDYRPIFSFASHFAWTHGYRSQAARAAAAGPGTPLLPPAPPRPSASSPAR